MSKMKLYLKILAVIFLIAIFSACQKKAYFSSSEAQYYDLKEEQNLTEDTDIKDFIKPYKVELDKEMDKVIGRTDKEMVKAKPESELGNWMADILLHQSEIYTKKEIDFAAVNYGGIRVPSLSKGDITKGKIFQLMPFDNLVVVLELDKKIMLQLFELMASKGGWPISKTVQYTIKNGKPTDIKIKGKTLEDNKTYTFAISDYIANGGDSCFFLKDAKRDNTGKLLRDALLEFIEADTANGNIQTASKENRVIVE